MTSTQCLPANRFSTIADYKTTAICSDILSSQFVTHTLNLCFLFSIRHQVSCLQMTGKIIVLQLETGNLSTHPTQHTNTKL
jgi:hypothetical protein